MDQIDRIFAIRLILVVAIATCVLGVAWVVFSLMGGLLAMSISQAMSYVLVGMLGWLIGRVQQ